MHSATLLLTVGFTMAVIISAAPLSDPTPTMHPLFQVVSRIPISTATGVANATTGKPSNHKHTLDCEHNSNANHTTTTDDAHKSSPQVADHDGEGKSLEATSTENLSPYPGFNASAYGHPHAVQAHNHTGYNCNHTSHHNQTTASHGAYNEISTPNMLNTSADSSHTQTGYRCAHPSHPSRTTAGHGYDKRSVVPEVEVRVCLGGDCKDSTEVTANLDGAGQLTGIEAKNSKGIVGRQDTGLTYEDIAREMSGARVAGGM